VKFKTDAFDERELKLKDSDGDTLHITVYDGNECNAVIGINHAYIGLSRKKLRKLAKAILKETAK
jgi:hypothetical protein